MVDDFFCELYVLVVAFVVELVLVDHAFVGGFVDVVRIMVQGGFRLSSAGYPHHPERNREIVSEVELLNARLSYWQ